MTFTFPVLPSLLLSRPRQSVFGIFASVSNAPLPYCSSQLDWPFTEALLCKAQSHPLHSTPCLLEGLRVSYGSVLGALERAYIVTSRHPVSPTGALRPGLTVPLWPQGAFRSLAGGERSLSTLKSVLAEQIPAKQAELLKLKKEHGHKSVGEVLGAAGAISVSCAPKAHRRTARVHKHTLHLKKIAAVEVVGC